MKILTVFTGGTIACSSVGGVLSPDSGNSFLLLDMYKQLDEKTEFETAFPYSILSENLSEENLDKLYSCLKGYDLSGFNGVIIAHGTDTLQYTGAFLSLRLGLCDTPVVLVSANFPLSDSRSNGFENFRATVSFIKSALGRGVFIAYKNTAGSRVNIHRASRALPHLPYSDDLFSLYNQPYGYVKGEGFVPNPGYSEDESEFEVTAAPFNKRVLYIRPYVGITYPVLEREYKAVLLDSYHSGTIATAGEQLRSFCREAKEKHIPVYLTGSCEGFNYESKGMYSSLGIEVLPPMSPIKAYMMLWLS